jgi:hypothetical protein
MLYNNLVKIKYFLTFEYAAALSTGYKYCLLEEIMSNGQIGAVYEA